MAQVADYEAHPCLRYFYNLAYGSSAAFLLVPFFIFLKFKLNLISLSFLLRLFVFLVVLSDC
jgi:hypothetical protein